tara:strand:- start:968 stop:1285 length:318 start_codon:yes stop_codon:yes gene_type:complete
MYKCQLFSKFINKQYVFDSFESLKIDWAGTSGSKETFSIVSALVASQTNHLKDPYGKWPSLTVRTLFPGPQNDGEIALCYNYPNIRRVKVMTRCDGSQIETWIEE